MIIDNETLPVFELPGLRHQTIADHTQGMKTMEVWCQGANVMIVAGNKDKGEGATIHSVVRQR